MKNLLQLLLLASVLVFSSEVAARDNAPTTPRTSYTCSGLTCQCSGEDDCNKMFEDKVCGDIATCDDRTGICKCFILKRIPKYTRPPTGIYKPPTQVN
ncbi:hypothetical protein [Thiofilum flexile]|uniref:hypothetical protein n=1 Tax=Thiofilum flexile TaxID=125627 RepID=UPI000370EB20|nr:hypothetical protein [Thiofilum flexile]